MIENQILKKYVFGQETALINMYLRQGEAAIREQYVLTEQEWEVIFDYLVFGHNLIYKAVIQENDYYLQEYVEKGMAGLRERFGITEEKYDIPFQVVFDHLAIACDGLRNHVERYNVRYREVLKIRGSEFVRKVLCVFHERYEENWRMVLDSLLSAVCDDIFSSRTFDDGLKAFSMIMNQRRDHRPLWKSGIV